MGDINKSVESLEFYKYYAKLFENYFPSVSLQSVSELNNAGYSYYLSILAIDALIDKNDVSQISNICNHQEDAIKILANLFNSKSNFWSIWQKRKNEFNYANFLNSNLIKTNHFSILQYEELADKKAVFGKVAIDALNELSGDLNAYTYNILLASHYYFSVGFQLYDDVKDFGEDIFQNQANFAISELRQILNFEKYSVSDLEKMLFISNVGQNILQKSIKYFQKSIDLILPLCIESNWLAINYEMKNIIQNYLNSSNGYLQTLKKRIELRTTRKSKSFQFINIKKVNSKPMRLGLEFICDDYCQGFSDLCHIMYLSKSDGFDNISEIHYTDIFQRALLADCLMEVANNYFLEAWQFLNSECEYLILNRKKDNIGSWSYFPSVKEIAADIDDLAQIIQLFYKMGRNDLICNYCLGPINIVINNRLCLNGGIETWILPKTNLNKIQKIQETFNKTKWGEGPDLEVVANFI